MDNENTVLDEYSDIEVQDVVESTETEYTEVIDYTQLLTEISVDANNLHYEVQKINADVRIILCIVLLSFCWSCMRGWRRNVTKEWR